MDRQEDSSAVVAARAVLVAGGPGAGKSTVSQELRDRGCRSIDLDLGYSRWEDEDGNPVRFPESPTMPWLRQHHWRWRIELLRETVESFTHQGQETVVFTGTAANMFDHLDLFDRLLLLRMDDATREARLVDPSRRNVFGRVGETASWSQWWHQKVEAELQHRGAYVIDACKSVSAVVDQVLAACR